MKYFEVIFKILAPKEQHSDVCDVLAAMAGEVGFESFELTEAGLKGYVQQDVFQATSLDEIVGALPFPDVTVEYQYAEADHRDWNEQWEQEGFEPIIVSPHLIIYDGRHCPSVVPDDCLLVEIDAKMAFGTGNHETTRMMAHALTNLNLEGTMVLDCGTGTGILAIIALLRGASSAIGYDIDEWSVDNARHNAVLNHVDERFTSILGDSIVIGQTGKHFDVVMANINRNILLADMPRMRQAMNDDALLLLSGFYLSDAEMLSVKAQELGMTPVKAYSEGEWACLVFKNQH